MALQLEEVLRLLVVAAIDTRVLRQDERFPLVTCGSVPVGLALGPASPKQDPTECPDLPRAAPCAINTAHSQPWFSKKLWILLARCCANWFSCLLLFLPSYLSSGEVHSRTWGKRGSWKKYLESWCTVSPYTRSQQLLNLKSQDFVWAWTHVQGDLGVGSSWHPKIHRGKMFSHWHGTACAWMALLQNVP